MNNCIFCRIVKREIPAEIVHEGPNVVAFKDIHPQAPVHILIIPKKHVARVMEFSSDDMSLVGDIHRAIQDLAKQHSVDENGFRLVVNNGAYAGQAVDHVHYHLLGGRKFGWPPG